MVDAVCAVRAQHNRPDFIIGYRFSPEEGGDNGITMADTFALIDALAAKPLQYLHVSLWDFNKPVRRGADTNQTRMAAIHRHLAGKLPLIGVGNLNTADKVQAAYETGWAELIAVGKGVLVNPNFATLIAQGRAQEIATAIDPNRRSDYRYPDNLWAQNLQQLAYLPPLVSDQATNA